MKTLLLLACLTLTSTLFALGQQDEAEHDENDRISREGLIITGGFEEVALLSCDPGLMEFVRQCAGKSDKPADQTGSEDIPETEAVRIFRQVVRGFKYVTCVKLTSGDLAVFIIHKDISGEFSLLEAYRGTEIFNYFSGFLLGNVSCLGKSTNFFT